MDIKCFMFYIWIYSRKTIWGFGIGIGIAGLIISLGLLALFIWVVIKLMMHFGVI